MTPRLKVMGTTVVRGKNLLGQDATLTIDPTDQPGWFWCVDGEDIPITTAIVDLKLRRLRFVYGSHRLNGVEHILALGQMGVDSARISCTHAWPPYDGRAEALRSEIASHLAARGILLPTYAKESIRCTNGRKKVEYIPFPRDRLNVEVSVKYAGIGGIVIRRSFAGGLDQKLCRARTISVWPAPLCWILKRLPTRIWPHYDKTYWLGEHYPHEVLEEIALHRVLDMFGAIKLILPPGKVFVGTLRSHLAGHALDIALLREIERVGLDEEFAW